MRRWQSRAGSPEPNNHATLGAERAMKAAPDRICVVSHGRMARSPAAGREGLFEDLAEAGLAVDDLGLEGGGGFYDRASSLPEEAEEVSLQLGGELVLAGLAGHHDGEGLVLALKDELCYGGAGF